MTDYTNPVPDSRTIVPGAWSDLLDKQLSTIKTDSAGKVSVKVSDTNTVAQAVLSGAMHAVNNGITLLAGESVGFEIRAAGGAFARFVNADGLTIKYVTSFTGVVLELGQSKSLNLTIDNGYRAFYNKYTNPVFTDDQIILSSQAPMSTEVFSANEVYIVVENNTGQTVTDNFSAGLQSVGEFTTPYGLEPSTALIATTQMSIFNGLN
jgi:hypothetical protein